MRPLNLALGWTRRDRKMPFARIANQALRQTLPRAVCTGMGTAFILAALAVLGGDALTDFALALLIGLAVAPTPRCSPSHRWPSTSQAPH
ncbi:hypothetical protein [Streptomyces canus]|uniref:hypothetical protein n=1 Tax=Streptomyces canus TaxID=58343 RepID=UPI0027D7A594|nr:hypothetical protein [Streptomyces canus]